MFEKYTEEFNRYLVDEISFYPSISNTLFESMNYSVLAGGKRFRPILMILIANAINLDYKKIFDSGIAIEFIHTFSLIHDDLPCMDDDDLRRGKPTNHIVFGEDLALLAGDGLNTYAFKFLMKTIKDNNLSIDIANIFIDSIMRMIEGQVLDMSDDDKDIDYLKRIHEHKTGALIEFSILAPLYINGSNENLIDKMRKFAYHLGLSFQIKDDILDYESDSITLGKSASDFTNNKTTYVSLLGIDKAKEYLKENIDQCLCILEENQLDTKELVYLCDYSMNREK